MALHTDLTIGQYFERQAAADPDRDFIKPDISPRHATDTTVIKEDLVQTMGRFANDHGAMVIAEGVERAEEFKMVQDLGVHLVQGFFLHRPQSASSPIVKSVAVP